MAEGAIALFSPALQLGWRKAQFLCLRAAHGSAGAPSCKPPPPRTLGAGTLCEGMCRPAAAVAAAAAAAVAAVAAAAAHVEDAMTMHACGAAEQPDSPGQRGPPSGTVEWGCLAPSNDQCSHNAQGSPNRCHDLRPSAASQCRNRRCSALAALAASALRCRRHKLRRLSKFQRRWHGRPACRPAAHATPRDSGGAGAASQISPSPGPRGPFP
mmetsp:Transcript_964/g.1997  ORF Transcript_964/g.1997 Transcript_964/m.1997 type:complete len:212 (+) Transcript_964:77-712(+)